MIEQLRGPQGVLKTTPLHTLWTKAVGAHDYVKQEWRDMEDMVVIGQVAREKLAEVEKERDSLKEQLQGLPFPDERKEAQ